MAVCFRTREDFDPTYPPANPIPVGTSTRLRRGTLTVTLSLIKVGPPEARRRKGLSGVKSPRRGWACRARGRTGCSRSPGGTERRCGAQGLAHRASPLLRRGSSPNTSSPSPDSQGWLAHTHALHWRISWQSRLPPGVLGDALHQGLPLRSNRETKGQSDRCSLAG